MKPGLNCFYLESHARAALQDESNDPIRHASIRDFQTRLENLGALKNIEIKDLEGMSNFIEIYNC